MYPVLKLVSGEVKEMFKILLLNEHTIQWERKTQVQERVTEQDKQLKSRCRGSGSPTVVRGPLHQEQLGGLLNTLVAQLSPVGEGDHSKWVHAAGVL